MKEFLTAAAEEGIVSPSDHIVCAACHGKGCVSVVRADLLAGPVQLETCARCSGSGRIKLLPMERASIAKALA